MLIGGDEFCTDVPDEVYIADAVVPNVDSYATPNALSRDLRDPALSTYGALTASHFSLRSSAQREFPFSQTQETRISFS